jgi:hypothetical protein
MLDASNHIRHLAEQEKSLLLLRGNSGDAFFANSNNRLTSIGC